MSEPAPLPLVLTTTIPLVLGLLPILLLLIALIHPATCSRLTTTSISLPTLSSITKQPATTTKKASKIRPLLLSAQGVANDRKKMVRREDFGMTPRPSMDGDSGGLHGMFGSVTPGQVVEAEVQKAKPEAENGKEMMVRNLKIVMIMASVAIISGVLYLVFEPKTSSKAVQIALSFSILSLPLTIGCLFLTYLTPSLSALSFPVLSGSIFIPTIALATISAFTSLYLTLALPLIPLLHLSALALYRQSSRPGRIRLSYAEGEKKRGLFSGQTGRILGLGVSTRGREGEMEVMRPDSSWLTESVDQIDVTERFSSFSYESSVNSPRGGKGRRGGKRSNLPGESSFVLGNESDSDSALPTPRTPDRAFTATRSCSRQSTHPRESEELDRSRKNSWISEPSKTPTSFASFSFGDLNQPVPELPTPYRNGRSEDEGPSILKSSNPLDMSFGSLAMPMGLRPLRNKASTLSEETFHSAIDEDDEGDQSFPRSISMTMSETNAGEFKGKNVVRGYFSGHEGEEGEELRDEEGVRDEIRARASSESKRSRAPSPLGSPPPTPLPPCPTSTRVGRPRAASETSRIGKEIIRSGSSLAGSRPGSTVPQYITMPIKNEPGPLPSASRAFSPFSYNSILTPATSAFGLNEKFSTDPLLLPGGSSGRMTSNGYNNQADIDQIIEAADMANESSLMEEKSKASGRLKLCYMVALIGLWVSWGLAVPILLNLGAEMAKTAVTLYLVAIIAPTPLLFSLVLLSRHIPSEAFPLNGNSEERRYDEKRNSLQSVRSGLARIADMSSRSIIPDSVVNRRTPASWSAAFPKLSKVGYKRSSPVPTKQGARDVDLEHAGSGDVQMNRLSRDVWLEQGHARRSSGKIDRFISMMAPHPQLQMMSPPRCASAPPVDPDATPRPIKRMSSQIPTGKPIDMSPLSFRETLSYDCYPSHELKPPPTIEVDTPKKHDRSFNRHSIATSPGAKSVKAAKVQTAVRGRMSKPPILMFGGSQGDMIITPRQSMEAAGLVDESQGQILVTQVSGQISDTQPAQLDEGLSLPLAKRASQISQQGVDLKQRRRRTFDFARNLLSKAKPVEDEGLEMQEKESSPVMIPEAQPHETPGNRTSSSTRPSMDLPPFRPSLDFVPPPLPTHGFSSSLDLGRASLDFGSPAAVIHSTPHNKETNLRRRGSHKSNHSLPTLTPKTGLLEEVKVALKQYGRSIDTPAKPTADKKRTPIKRKSSGDGNKLSKSPLKGILKSRPSLDSLAAGIDLPPIPTQMKKAANKETKAAQRLSKGQADKVVTSSQAGHASTSNPPETPPVVKSTSQRVDVQHTPLYPVSEQDETSIHSSLNFSAPAPRSVGHETNQMEHLDPLQTDERGLPLDAIELSFEHDEAGLEEMEMVLTRLNRESTEMYMSASADISFAPSLKGSLPPTLAGHASEEHLRLPATSANKFSTDTFATMESINSVDPVHDSPSPAIHPHPSRASLNLAYSAGRTETSVKKSVRTSVHGNNQISKVQPVPVRAGLRPLILGQILRGERESVVLGPSQNQNLVVPAKTGKEEHERGDSVFKFDDAEEDTLFTVSPVKKIRRKPLDDISHAQSRDTRSRENPSAKRRENPKDTQPREVKDRSRSPSKIVGPRPSSRAGTRPYAPTTARSVRI